MSNCIIKSINYFNPFSNQFKEASKDFSDLTLTRKILAVSAGILGGLITPFLLFTGSFAGFQVSVKWLKQGNKQIEQAVQRTDLFSPQEILDTSIREFGPGDDPGEFTGFVKKTFANGTVYEGEYVDGQFEGMGVLTVPGEEGYVYRGQFQKGIKHGQGKGTFANGTVYEGEHKGQFEGIGVFTVPGENGCVYEGQFHQGKPHGQGKRTFTNGNVYEGGYVDGNMEGIGVFTVSDGRIYQGIFHNNLPTGEGMYTDKQGIQREGEFIPFDGNLRFRPKDSTVIETIPSL